MVECFQCGGDHYARECPERGSGGKGGSKGKGCFNCGGDHLARDCPQGGGKGKGKGNGKGQWKWVRFRPELTPEEIEERKKASAERHAKRVEEEERKIVTDSHLEGEVLQRAKWHAWIKPKNPSAVPEDVMSKIKEMNDAFRAKVTEGRNFCGGTEDQVVYLAVADIAEDSLVLRPGLAVKFKLYVDNKGVGACDVISGEPEPETPAEPPAAA
uniref:CCHC-type domain-containing protein n=1 Tax=Zooxanthella nutricula TaxID=1333877 RepID=A0A7S2LJT7_9DINO